METTTTTIKTTTTTTETTTTEDAKAERLRHLFEAYQATDLDAACCANTPRHAEATVRAVDAFAACVAALLAETTGSVYWELGVALEEHAKAKRASALVRDREWRAWQGELHAAAQAFGGGR